MDHRRRVCHGAHEYIPMQPRQRQQLLSIPLDTADGSGQDPEADQGLGVNSFKTIAEKPSRHRSMGRAPLQQFEMLLAPSQCRKATSTEVLHQCTTWIGQSASRQQAL